MHCILCVLVASIVFIPTALAANFEDVPFEIPKTFPESISVVHEIVCSSNDVVFYRGPFYQTIRGTLKMQRGRIANIKVEVLNAVHSSNSRALCYIYIGSTTSNDPILIAAKNKIDRQVSSLYHPPPPNAFTLPPDPYWSNVNGMGFYTSGYRTGLYYLTPLVDVSADNANLSESMDQSLTNCRVTFSDPPELPFTLHLPFTGVKESNTESATPRIDFTTTPELDINDVVKIPIEKDQLSADFSIRVVADMMSEMRAESFRVDSHKHKWEYFTQSAAFCSINNSQIFSIHDPLDVGNITSDVQNPTLFTPTNYHVDFKGGIPPFRFKWYFEDNTAESAVNSIVYAFRKLGNSVVYCEVTDATNFTVRTQSMLYNIDYSKEDKELFDLYNSASSEAAETVVSVADDTEDTQSIGEGQKPVIIGRRSINALQGQLVFYEFTILNFDFYSDIIDITGIPYGLNYKTGSTIISGTSSEIGIFSVVITATNKFGSTYFILKIEIKENVVEPNSFKAIKYAETYSIGNNNTQKSKATLSFSMKPPAISVADSVFSVSIGDIMISSRLGEKNTTFNAQDRSGNTRIVRASIKKSKDKIKFQIKIDGSSCLATRNIEATSKIGEQRTIALVAKVGENSAIGSIVVALKAKENGRIFNAKLNGGKMEN